MVDLDILLADVEDEIWKSQIKNSVESICVLYDLEPDSLLIYRQTVSPETIYVAAVEEFTVEKAKKHLKEKRGTGTPVTVIQHKNKNVIFTGSSRSLQYLLQNQFPECIVIRLPDYLEPKIISEAQTTLREIFENQS